MKIRQLRSRRFAGLKDVDIGFAPGLNVILGPNEAGKSTMMEAIRWGLLSRVVLKGDERRDFERRYLPLEGGDTVDVELLIGTSKGDLRLAKTFGSRPSVQLEVGVGALVTRETAVYQQLSTMLGCGERTIDVLVFARQGDFHHLLSQVTSQDLAQNLSNVLQQAVLEMDGVSVRAIENAQNEAIELLLKHWDWEKGGPESGRGIERPYQRGVGQVLAAYYQREQIGKSMKQVLDTEQRLAILVSQIKEMQAVLSHKRTEFELFESMDSDMVRRLELEPQLLKLSDNIEKISSDINEWPIAEHNLERKEAKLIEIMTRLSLIKVEEEHSQIRESRGKLLDLKDRVEKCQLQVELLGQEIADLLPVGEAQMAEIEALIRRMEDLKLSLQAAQMQIKLTLAPGQEGNLICDFDEGPVSGDHEGEASGYLCLTIDGVAVIEVSSGDKDYVGLKTEYEECRSAIGGILLARGVNSIEDVRYSYRRALAINREIDGLQVMAAMLLGDRTLEDINQELLTREGLPPARPLPEIKQEQEALWGQEVLLRQEISNLQAYLREMQTNYGQRDRASDILTRLQREYRSLQEEIDTLQELPPGFTSASSFRSYLNQCRQELTAWEQDYTDLRTLYRETEASLVGEGYEELLRQYERADVKFQQVINQAQVLLRTQQALAATRTEIRKVAQQPIIDHLACQVTELTGGRYGVIGAAGFLEFNLQHQDDYQMPINLLSAGTLNLVALAFRLALLDRVFPTGDGMVVLDDCLVDLDPERRQRAAVMIKKWAEEHQVIFVTCDPGTADLLGGNIIQLG